MQAPLEKIKSELQAVQIELFGLTLIQPETLVHPPSTILIPELHFEHDAKFVQ
jgi:hypothetical protein